MAKGKFPDSEGFGTTASLNVAFAQYARNPKPVSLEGLQKNTPIALEDLPVFQDLLTAAQQEEWKDMRGTPEMPPGSKLPSFGPNGEWLDR
jgi:hypothetical protein